MSKEKKKNSRVQRKKIRKRPFHMRVIVSAPLPAYPSSEIQARRPARRQTGQGFRAVKEEEDVRLALGEGPELALGALAVGDGVDFGGLLALGLEHALELLADIVDAGAARAGESHGVAVVGVDAGNVGRDAVGLQVDDDARAGANLLGTVAAGAEELADGDDGILWVLC